jgi:predicted metal-dependent HD superfamily phosphohydrolase
VSAIDKYIASRWERTMALLRVRNHREESAALIEVCQRYTEGHRHYHTLEHLQTCFNVLDVEMAKFSGLGSIELALWYHDIVYDTKAHDNEEKSAQIAEARIIRLGMPEAFAQQVGNLIRATTHKNVPGTREAQVLLDVDTVILSEPEAAFDKYEQDIREEYSWVPEADFKAGRTKVLESFLSRQWLYSTPEFRNSWREGLARQNLTRSLASLRL